MRLAPSIRAAVKAMDPLLPVEPRAMTDIVSASLTRQRLGMTLMLLFAAAALALAAVGIYGVISYASAQRTGEVATRMALGATPSNVFWLMMNQGRVAGDCSARSPASPSAYAAGRAGSSLLYEVRASDPLILLVGNRARRRHHLPVDRRPRPTRVARRSVARAPPRLSPSAAPPVRGLITREIGGPMDNEQAVMKLVDQPALDAIAKPLSKGVRGAFESAGEPGQRLKNALHGVQLGHPLHPVFTDIPIGAWTTAMVLACVAQSRGDRGMERAADVAIAVGLAGAAGAAVTGLTDWSETSGHARRTGIIHGLLNIAATSLFATAYVLRRQGARGSGTSCAFRATQSRSDRHGWRGSRVRPAGRRHARHARRAGQIHVCRAIGRRHRRWNDSRGTLRRRPPVARSTAMCARLPTPVRTSEGPSPKAR